MLQRRPVSTYVLRPLDRAKGDQEFNELPPESSHESPQQCTSPSDSYALVSLPVEEDQSQDPSGILLEANREFCIKLFMGEVVHLLYIWNNKRTHLLFTDRSRVGVAHTCISHVARFSDIQSCSFQ